MKTARSRSRAGLVRTPRIRVRCDPTAERSDYQRVARSAFSPLRKTPRPRMRRLLSRELWRVSAVNQHPLRELGELNGVERIGRLRENEVSGRERSGLADGA